MYGMFETHVTHGHQRDLDVLEREHVVYRTASDRSGLGIARAVRVTIARVFHGDPASTRDRDARPAPVFPAVPATPTRADD